jgi:hypothetical protein
MRLTPFTLASRATFMCENVAGHLDVQFTAADFGEQRLP